MAWVSGFYALWTRELVRRREKVDIEEGRCGELCCLCAEVVVVEGKGP
jgi:hypothetical protein